MSDLSERNVFLILIRLDLTEANPLGQPWPGAQGLPKMDEDKNYTLIAGLLDASQQTTRTPLLPIPFISSEQKEFYNSIVSRFEELIELFYGPDHGLVSFPERFDGRAQAEIERAIREIGRDIFDLFPRSTPLSTWLDRVFKGERSALEHVTIITNDFNIPWYWMKNTAASLMLCEVSALGMLQLTSRTFIEPDEDKGSDNSGGRNLHALLINGSGGSDLPFSGSQLKSLQDFIQAGKDFPDAKERLRPFKVDLVTEGAGVRALMADHGREDARGLYRLVHYSGHWNYEDMQSVTGKASSERDSKKELWVGDKPMSVADLKEFVESAVLALDGCSSSHGLQAWSEVENLTGKILNLGALGCVVTTLPVKDDPIISDKFWETFYGSFLRRRGPMTLGQALRKARAALKEHLRATGSKNPAWAFYQLIGNPSVRLIDESTSSDG